jgi:hypothetical protein
MDVRELEQCGTTVQRHPWELSRRAFAERLVSDIEKHKPAGIRRALDLGCGDAFVARGLAARFPGIRLDAVDTALGPHFLRRMKKAGIPANLHFSDAWERLDARQGRIDLVLLLDVLEHIEHDASFLRSLSDSPLIQRDTSFVITVPAMPVLYSSHDRCLGHYRRYTLSQIRRTCESAGLETLEAGYCYLLGFFVRGLRCLLERIGLLSPLRATAVTAWRAGPLWTRWCQRVLALDLSISRLLARLRISLPGLSCYIVCRKPG